MKVIRPHFRLTLLLGQFLSGNSYRAEKKGLNVIAKYFFLALLSFSAWHCLAVAKFAYLFSHLFIYEHIRVLMVMLWV